MRRLTALALLVASFAFAAPHPAQATPSSARRIAVTTIPTIRVWVTLYKGGFANMRSIVASGWMTDANAFYIHFGMGHGDSYYIRGQVHDASRVIADTTAQLTKDGVPIVLYRRGTSYHWDY